MNAATVAVLCADTVTRLDGRHAGSVLVAGSHRGAIAAQFAVAARLRAAIFDDVGGVLDAAGRVAGVAAASAGVSRR